MPLFFRVDPATVETRLPAGETWTLAELQALVEGSIEVVHLPDGGQLIINEEGRVFNLPLNVLASVLTGIVLVGPVLYIPAHEVAQYGLK